MFDTKFCENLSKFLNFRQIWIFLFFWWWHQILKIRCIHEASSVSKAKSSNVLPQRTNFMKLLRKQYGNPDSHHEQVNERLSFTISLSLAYSLDSSFSRAHNERVQRSLSPVTPSRKRYKYSFKCGVRIFRRKKTTFLWIFFRNSNEVNLLKPFVHYCVLFKQHSVIFSCKNIHK